MRLRPAALLAVLATLAVPAAAGAVTITEFEIEPGSAPGTHAPRYIQPGPDGALWFTNGGARAGIGRISTSGAPLGVIPDGIDPVDLLVMADGTVVWTGELGIRRRTSDGALSPLLGEFGVSYAIGLSETGQFRVGLAAADGPRVCGLTGVWGTAMECGPLDDDTLAPGARVTDLTNSADGGLWAAYYELGRIRRLRADGLAGGLDIGLPAGSGPARIALGPDGNLWATMYDAGAVDRITPAGGRTRFALPAGSGPNDIAAGPDGALWITDLQRGRILRMGTDGAVTADLAIPTPGSQPIGITAGPDGALWFTESATGRIGRIALSGGAAGGGGGAVGGGSSTARDRAAPRFLRRASFDPSRFTRRRGSELFFVLSEAGRARIRIERRAVGRRAGGRCVETTRRNRARSRCTRYETVGSLTRTVRQGANVIAFDARVGGRALAPRSYRVTVTVADAAGNTSRPSRATFIVRR